MSRKNRRKNPFPHRKRRRTKPVMDGTAAVTGADTAETARAHPIPRRSGKMFRRPPKIRAVRLKSPLHAPLGRPVPGMTGQKQTVPGRNSGPKRMRLQPGKRAAVLTRQMPPDAAVTGAGAAIAAEAAEIPAARPPRNKTV